MKKYTASGFLLALALFFGTMYAMEDCYPVAMQKETFSNTFSKKSIYGHIANCSLYDALAYVRELQPINQIDIATIKQVRVNLEHFHTLYNHYIFTQNISKLSLNKAKNTASSIFSPVDSILECTIKMQQDGLPMAELLICSADLFYMLNVYQNRQGQSLLHCATSTNNEQFIRWLFTYIEKHPLVLQNNFINTVNVQGQTPLNVAMASINENESIITLFIEKGAIYNAPKAPAIRSRELVIDKGSELEQYA